jgi:predicted O-methyltransferase YrrM
MGLAIFWFRITEAIHFYFKASTVHTIDSPFVFQLVRALFNREPLPWLDKIDSIRKKILSEKRTFKRIDLGQGSSAAPGRQASVELGSWAKRSSIDPFYGGILHRLTKELQPTNLLELGTAVGLSAAYMASAIDQGQLTTIEGDPFLAEVARQTCDTLGFTNVQIKQGSFETVLKTIPLTEKKYQLIYIDGHHHPDAVHQYLDNLTHTLNGFRAVIVDDIRWSPDMLAGWKSLVKRPEWNLRIDIFRMGILLYHPLLQFPMTIKVAPHWIKPWSLGLWR